MQYGALYVSLLFSPRLCAASWTAGLLQYLVLVEDEESDEQMDEIEDAFQMEDVMGSSSESEEESSDEDSDEESSEDPCTCMAESSDESEQ